jgi:hypothetical protein
MRQRLGEDRRLQRERRLEPVAADVGEAAARIALAVRAHRHIDGQHQRIQAGVVDAADHVVGDLRIARGIELIPGMLRRGAPCRLDRLVARGGHDVGNVGVLRGGREHHVGAAAEQTGAAGRRDAERARVGPAEDGRRLVAAGDVDQVARQQAVLAERVGVAVEPALVVEPALDDVERRLRQAALGYLVQVLDIDRVVEPHLAMAPTDFPHIRSPISQAGDNF